MITAASVSTRATAARRMTHFFAVRSSRSRRPPSPFALPRPPVLEGREDRDGGPDTLWALTSKQYVVIELKTDVTRPNPAITKKEAGQLVHSMTWFANRYPDVSASLPLLVHPSEELSADAHLPAGTRIMTQAHMNELRIDVEAFVAELAAAGLWSSPVAVVSAIQRYRLSAEQVIARHSKTV